MVGGGFYDLGRTFDRVLIFKISPKNQERDCVFDQNETLYSYVDFFANPFLPKIKYFYFLITPLLLRPPKSRSRTNFCLNKHPTFSRSSSTHSPDHFQKLNPNPYLQKIKTAVTDNPLPTYTHPPQPQPNPHPLK